MQLLENGKPYWKVARQYHQGDRSRLATSVAVFQMVKLADEVASPAALGRVKGFISKHRAELPSNGEIGGGGGAA